MNYILCGELYPILRKHLNKILKERLGEPNNFNVVKIDFEESPVEQIVYEASSLPLGYDKKAVVVDNATLLTKEADPKDEKQIVELLQKSTNDIDLIFILRNDKINKQGEIFNYVNGIYIECEYLYFYEYEENSYNYYLYNRWAFTIFISVIIFLAQLGISVFIIIDMI